ncbi:MAG: DUF1285 domain-containing protein [Halioglobus sp.]
MNDQLDSIKKKVGRNFESPPLHLWNPPLSGDIDIRIDKAGRWIHEGVEIKRDAIVRLFASILRREDDLEYYLVTPGEKWRIQVDALPLIVVDVDRQELGTSETVIEVTLNTRKKLHLGAHHRLYLEEAHDHIAAVQLNHGLTALFARSAWYRLVEMSEQKQGRACIVSAGEIFPLEA